MLDNSCTQAAICSVDREHQSIDHGKWRSCGFLSRLQSSKYRHINGSFASPAYYSLGRRLRSVSKPRGKWRYQPSSCLAHQVRSTSTYLARTPGHSELWLKGHNSWEKVVGEKVVRTELRITRGRRKNCSWFRKTKFNYNCHLCCVRLRDISCVRMLLSLK